MLLMFNVPSFSCLVLVEKLLQINDIINNVLEQYGQVKIGRLVKAAVPSIGQNDNNNIGSSGASAQDESSLIDLVDFGGSDNGPPQTTSSAPAPPTTGNLMDDLMSLNFNDGPPPAWGAAGSISLGQSISPAASFNSNSSSSFNAGAPPTYNMFSSGGNNTSSSGSPAFSNSPMLQPLPLSSSSRPATPGHVPQPVLSSTANSGFDDFDFVSNTGTAQSGPTTGNKVIFVVVFM